MNKNYYKKDSWWVSPYNFDDEVINRLDFSDKIEIHDATLRDGEQTPGVVFSIEDKVEITKLLDSVGIERIEAGMPAVSEDDLKAIKRITKLGLKSKIFTFSRAMELDIDMAYECGAEGVVIEVPIGYPKLKYQFGWTWEDVLKKSVSTINYARKKGLYVVYFPYDTTRANNEDLENLIGGIMKHSPPDSVGVVDTMGCAMPYTIEYLVRKMRRMTNELPIEVHTHNDFGMGVATELAGVAAGAKVIHSCVNGLGERTGNAATEELAVGLKMLMGLNDHYNLDKLIPLSDYVEKASGIKLAPNKPIVGLRNYTRESGIGVDLVLEEPLAMFATDPSYFNKKGEIVLGKKSGKASIEYYLNKKGIKVSEDIASLVLLEVKRLGIENRRLVTENEFEQILKKYMKSN